MLKSLVSQLTPNASMVKQLFDVIVIGTEIR